MRPNRVSDGKGFKMTEIVTPEEKEAFLNRRGWKKATAEGKVILEEEWTDEKIRMALDLNLG